MVDVEVDRLESLLKEKLDRLTDFADDATKKQKLKKTFQFFDKDKTGSVDKFEFEQALYNLNFVGVQGPVKALFERYDETDDGRISYAEFTDSFFNNTLLPDANSKSIVERVKAKIISRGGKNGIRTCTKILCRMDQSGDLKLQPAEFMEGMQVYGFHMDADDVEKLMKYFDRDNSGHITIEEFLRGVRGRMAKRRVKLVLKAWGMLNGTAEGNKEDVVTMAEMGSKYDCSQAEEVLAGTKTEEEILEEFMGNWDKDGDAQITWAEFLDYYKDLSAGIENDDYFELMIRNAWHITGGEGWCENTSNRRVLVTWADDKSQEVVEIKNDLGVAADDVDEMKRRIEAQENREVLKISTAD